MRRLCSVKVTVLQAVVIVTITTGYGLLRYFEVTLVTVNLPCDITVKALTFTEVTNSKQLDISFVLCFSACFKLSILH